MNSNSKKDTLDRRSYEPAYVQLVRIVSQQIAVRTLRPGDQLLSEGQFCTQFNVSPMTVRRPWDDEFIVVQPRQVIQLEDIFPPSVNQADSWHD